MENALIITPECAGQGLLEEPETLRVGHSPRLRQWMCIGEWVLLALLVAYLGMRTLPRAWRTLNTDFPNYYLTAQLTREHYDTSRIYEWIWVQRQKDHCDIDQRIVGMVPITPKDVYMAARPVAEHDTVLFIAFMLDGYHSAANHFDTVQFSNSSHDDHLALTSTGGERWVEQASSTSTVMP